jgi:hypothetical protein
MSPEISKLRSPNELEALFYEELLAPLRAFAARRVNDDAHNRQVRMLARRFRKDILRYGFVVSEVGVLVQVEPDILDTKLDPTRLTMLTLDMQIIDRLRQRR